MAAATEKTFILKRKGQVTHHARPGYMREHQDLSEGRHGDRKRIKSLYCGFSRKKWVRQAKQVYDWLV